MTLKIENLHFSFNKETPVISELNFSLSKSQIVTIVGNSGCGKTTLLNLIAGFLLPTSGTIIATDTSSYLTQAITLLPYRNAFENSLLACELRNSLDIQKVEQASFLFKLFNLPTDTKKKFPNELSGGMKQRIGLIQTLLVDAKFFLLDEPFNAIDRNTILTIQNYVWNKFKTEKSSSIVVTHDLDQSILISDKILIMPNASSIYKEIVFDNHFASLSPEQRVNTDFYNKYLFEVIKALNNQ